jgi:hypothetical protein
MTTTTGTTGDGRMMYQDEAKVLSARDIEKVKAGEKAWRSMQRKATTLFAEWLVIGEAIETGRKFAEKKTGATKGRGYNETFSGWLKAHRFDAIHPTTRTALHNIMTWRADAVRWHKGLPDSRRGDLNHPTRIWQHFEREFEKEIAEEKTVKFLMKEGTSEEDARAQAAAMPPSEAIYAKPATPTEKLMAELDGARRDHAAAIRRVVELDEDNKQMRAELGRPEAPRQALVAGNVTEQEVLRIIERAVPRDWTIDQWDRLHEHLGEHIERLRAGGVLGQLTGERGKAQPKRKARDDLNDDVPL